MRIQIKGTGLELTPSLKTFIEEKLGGLVKYIQRWDKDDSVIVRVEVAKTTNHHHKGEIYYAEANMDLPHQVVRVEETNVDAHAAVEKLKDRLKTELLRIKEKMTAH